MFKKLLQLLMRVPEDTKGYGHYWCKESKITKWWPTHTPAKIPEISEDLYFGVHPSSISKLSNQRPTEEDILAINCLYADYDIKFFKTREATLKHIESIKLPPTAIILSGGGYHCYWVLTEPFLLSTSLRRKIAKNLQARWVDHYQGDLAVHDLARLLRIPGTKNYKYKPPKEVRLIKLDTDRLYELIELSSSLPETNNHRSEDLEELSIPEPVKPNDLNEQELVNVIMTSSDAEHFKTLFEGVDEGYASASEADMAFVCLLAFWTGGDYHKIDRIFRASKRMRPKWEREDYRKGTIIKALFTVDKHYVHPGGYLTAGAHDDGNAEVVAQKVKARVCYCEAFKWLRYVQGHWETELAEPYTEKYITNVLKDRRSAAVKAGAEAIVKATRPDAGRIMKTKTLLRHKVMVPVGEFDNDPDSINCINGVLNLRTGTLSPHHYEKRFTYVIPTRYNPDANESHWLDWLYEVAGNNTEVVDYLQLALGYTLSGRTREEIMFYLYGPLRAGKGVFIETLISMLGDRPIATEVDIDLFMKKGQAQSSSLFSLAALKAARFVAASESDEKQWLNARGIKRWTGGNHITCAHKYGRDFTYKPEFKIWLTSNYPPQMDAEDAAAWGRLRVISFPNSYAGHEDKRLKERMSSPQVMEGILKWCVEGAKAWYKLDKFGLQTPTHVAEETQRARMNLDWVATWIEENVRIGEGHLPSDVYYPDYKDWCQENGVSPKSLRSLNRALREAKYVVGFPIKLQGKTKRCWKGASLRGYAPGLNKLISKETT